MESLSKETGDRKEPNTNFTTKNTIKKTFKPMLYISIFLSTEWKGQKSQQIQR